MIEVFILIGIFFFPVFTLGCVLINFNYPILGVITLIVSIFFSKLKTDEEKFEEKH